jgi:hypothetical protein
MDTIQAETLVGNTIATPVATIVGTDGQDKPREILAIINDSNVGEPFTLYKGTEGAWWMKDNGVEKVEKLMFCLKNDMSIEEACFSIGITRNNYYYFVRIHPEFLNIKEQLSQALSAVAKLTLGNELQKDGNLALRYLQGTQPEKYRRSVMPELPQGINGYAKKTEELFMNEKGDVVVSHKTAMLLEQYDRANDNTQEEGE